MIIENLFNLITSFFSKIISVFNIPELPTDVTDRADSFLDLLFSNLSMLGLFVRISTLKTLAVTMLVLVNFKHIYAFAKWAISKIPFFKD